MRNISFFIFCIYTSLTAFSSPNISINIPEAHLKTTSYSEAHTPVAHENSGHLKNKNSNKTKLYIATTTLISIAAIGVITSFSTTSHTTTKDSIQKILPHYDPQFQEPTYEVEPQNIFAEDDRTIEKSGDYPFSAIGRLTFENEQGNRFHCTGTLVTEDAVLTAAHCVENDFGKRYKNFFFSAGAISGRSDPQAAARAKEIYSDSLYSSPTGEVNISYDWAIIKLTKPLGRTQGSLGLKINNKPTDSSINLAGYSGDILSGFTPTVHTNCRVRSFQSDGSYAHDCDMTGGSSGSGVTTQDFKYIFAINSHNFCNGDCDVDQWSEYTPGARNVAIRIDEPLRLLNQERGRFRSATSTIEPICVETPLLAAEATGVNRVNCTDFYNGLGVELPGSSDSDDLSSLSSYLSPSALTTIALGLTALFLP
ncbi:MAG: serine protease [Oligoflexales bacterium]